MNFEIKIELFEEHENVNLYTLRFRREETEVDKFLDQFPEGCKYDEDIDIIIKWIDRIGKKGALKRYFRPEGKNIWAVPIETNSLRLYVLRLSDEILILGNGGLKTTRTYNEDPNLNVCVELLQTIDGYIKARIRKGAIQIYGKQIFGNTTFHLKSKDDEE
ncbi:MAG: hypothetical protein U9R54_02495 [Bacteroidota bacterium]|nr:hypothetical protein [Bacteroidota bacterium]